MQITPITAQALEDYVAARDTFLELEEEDPRYVEAKALRDHAAVLLAELVAAEIEIGRRDAAGER